MKDFEIIRQYMGMKDEIGTKWDLKWKDGWCCNSVNFNFLPVVSLQQQTPGSSD